MRTRLSYHIYYMRCWLRLLWYSRSLLSYPLPISMLSPGGIDRNSSYLIYDYYNALIVSSNEINQNFWFDVLKKSIYISNIYIETHYYSICIVSIHKNNNLLPRRFFYYHIESRFAFLTQFVNNIINLVNYVNWEF